MGISLTIVHLAVLHVGLAVCRQAASGEPQSDTQSLSATELHNAGVRSLDKGDYRSAEAYFLVALRKWEGAAAPDLLSIASTLENLSAAYGGQARFLDAISVCMRAIDIRERVQGRDHADLAFMR